MNKRTFTRDFKLGVLQELTTKSAAQICREYNLGSSLLTHWKKEYDQNPQKAFAGRGNLWKDEAKVAERERLIGQLYAENAFLKKALERLQQLKAEQRRK